MFDAQLMFDRAVTSELMVTAPFNMDADWRFVRPPTVRVEKRFVVPVTFILSITSSELPMFEVPAMVSVPVMTVFVVPTFVTVPLRLEFAYTMRLP